MPKNESRRGQAGGAGARNEEVHSQIDHSGSQPGSQPPSRQKPIRPGLILRQGRPVASIEADGTLLRWAGPNEMLRQPAAWAFHPDVLDDAKTRGAILVRVVLRDGGRRTVYEAPLADFEFHGLPLDRGYGPQVALTLDHWQIDGRLAKADAPAQAKTVTDPEPALVQLSLFGGEQ